MLLTVQELAQLLHIKAATLYAWAARGQIPCLKIHGLVRFRKDEIDQWLESCQRPAPPETGALYPTKDRGDDVATLIARAKAAVYTPRRRGNQTEIKPYRKGGA